jgi:hypothetical protein
MGSPLMIAVSHRAAEEATRLRLAFGLDVARAVFGVSSPVVTEVYAALAGASAAEAMERIG